MLSRAQRLSLIEITCFNCGKPRIVVMDTIRKWTNSNIGKTMDDYKIEVPCLFCKIILKGGHIRGLGANHKVLDVKCSKCGKVRSIQSQAINSWLLKHSGKTVDDYNKENLCGRCVKLVYGKKDGKIETVSGYRLVLLEPSSPFYLMAQKHNGCVNLYCLEHRLVMAKILGRNLKEWEEPHHRDGNGLNNDPTNLELRILPHGRGASLKNYEEELLKRVEQLYKENQELKMALDKV